MHRFRNVLVVAQALGLVLVGGLAGCVMDVEPDEDLSVADSGDELSLVGNQGTITGTIAANGWVSHPLTIPQTAELTATLRWSSTKNLNLFLYNPSGILVDYALSDVGAPVENPKSVTATNAVAGTWSVAVKNPGTKALAYEITVGTPSTTTTVVGFPGRPAVGTVFWGSSIGGNGDPVVRHEQPSGQALSIRRTFFDWGQRTSGMINTAKDDIAHDRLPWVSVKPPSWAAMASGAYDAEIDAMLNALKSVPGPVWLTVHHEPEGGGSAGNTPDDPAGPAGHVDMNRRVRQRMTALNIRNVALAPILMTYTWTTFSGRNPDAWWATGIYDFLGVDHYMDAEASLLTPNFAKVRAWAAGKNTEMAIGEWGMRGTNTAAGQRVRNWFDAAVGSSNDGGGARVIALSAFDSGLNSPTGSWVLMGEQLTVFRQLLGSVKTASILDL